MLAMVLMAQAAPQGQGVGNFPYVDFGPLPSPSQCQPQQRPPPPVDLAGLEAGGWVTDYNERQVSVLGPNAVNVRLDLEAGFGPDRDPQGARLASKFAYRKGKFSARIKSGATVPGVVAAFYLSDYEPELPSERMQDEADFELMGARGAKYVQTNLFINGVGDREKQHLVPDHSTAFHKYTLEWDIDAGFVKSYIDDKLIRTDKVKAFRPQRVYVSYWGTKPCNSVYDMQVLYWAGLPRPSDYGKTYVMEMKDIQFEHSAPLPVQPRQVQSTNPKRSLAGQLALLKGHLDPVCAPLNPQNAVRTSKCPKKGKN